MGLEKNFGITKAHVWYSFLIQDFLSSYKYSLKWVDLFNSPKLINIHPVFYLKGNNYLLESITLLKHPIKFREVLQKMQKTLTSVEFPKNDNLSSLAFLYE